MTVKKATKMVGKKQHRLKKSNSDTLAMTFRAEGQIIPFQGITVSNYSFTTLPLLNQQMNIGVTQLKDFVLYNNMYDQVRVNSVSVTVTPKANVLEYTQAQNDNLFNLAGDGLLHHVIDRDGNPPTNIGSLQRYSSYRKTSVLKPFKRSYSVTYPPGVWLDSQNIYEDATLLKRLGLTGGIYIYGENFLEDSGEVYNEPVATISVSYNVVFRGKTSGNLTYNTETGAITVSPLLETSNAAPTPIMGVRGSIIDQTLVQDVSGGDGIQIEYNDSGVDDLNRGAAPL